MPSSSGSYSPPQDESPPTEGSSTTAAPPPLYILEDIFFMPTPPFQPQQCKPPPPQPLSSAVREANKTIDMELASDNPHLKFEVPWFCLGQLWESRKGRSGHMAPEVT
ncbi:hypothetical protein P8452_44807 [Trifolium repens]|nr:hypothetical protein P8452_44807 [Trifolium repens]